MSSIGTIIGGSHVMASVLFGSLSGIFWGVASPMLTSASRRMGNLSTTLIYHLTSFVALAGMALWNPDELLLPSTLLAHDLLHALLVGALLGLLSAAASLVLMQSFTLGPLSRVGPIFAINGPCAALFALILFQERLSLIQAGVLILMGLGILMASLERPVHKDIKTINQRGGVVPVGVFLAVLAALLFAGVDVGITALSKQEKTLWLVMLIFLRLCSTLVLIVVHVITNRWETTSGPAIKRTGDNVIPGVSICTAAGSGVLDGAGYVTFALGVAHLASVTMTMTASLLALIPLLAGLLMFRERLSWWQVFGLLTIIGGVVAFALPTFVLTGVLIVQHLLLGTALWFWFRRSTPKVLSLSQPLPLRKRVSRERRREAYDLKRSSW